MNNLKALITLVLKPKEAVVESFKSFHTVSVLSQRTLRGEYGCRITNENALFFTNLPKKKKEIQKKVKIPKGAIPSGSLIIQCKRPEFNHYSGVVHGKFDAVPLASKSWHHAKSKGDYFTILPSRLHPAFLTKEDLPMTFEDNGVSNEVIQQLKKLNINYPTAIQAKSCRHLLDGHNLFMSAECGSGKTLGYLIAMVENVLKWKGKLSSTYNSPIGIILLPTRELAIQVGVLASKLGSDLGVKCQTLLGGNTKDLLLNPEMVETDILTCTLQVFLKHMAAKLYSTQFCKHVVIDEIDSFLEESYLGQLKAFLYNSKLDFTGFASEKVTGQSAQICFASATVPKEMESDLFELIKGNDMKIETTPYLHRTISYAQQIFMRVTKTTRPEKLLKIVKNNLNTKTPTMIFSNKISTATWVTEFLNSSGVECGNITTKSYAEDRLRHYRNFEAGIVNVISCTDLGSRGLSFSRVKHVINFEFPSFMIDYIHRCGRTGRIDQGSDCKVTSFISGKQELYLLHKIEMAVRTNLPLSIIHSNRVKSYRSNYRPKNNTRFKNKFK